MRRELSELAQGRPRDDLRAPRIDVSDRLDHGEPVFARQREIGDEKNRRSEAVNDAEGFLAVPRDEHTNLERLDRFKAHGGPLDVGVRDEHVGELDVARDNRRPAILIVANTHINQARRHVGSCAPRPMSGRRLTAESPEFMRTRFLPSAFA